MICCHRSSEIPEGQPICPSCCASVSPDKREVPERSNFTSTESEDNNGQQGRR